MNSSGVVQVAEVISTSEQLELNPSRTRLRRTDPLDPEAAIEVVDGRSIYAKPFPFDVTLDGLMQFWNKVGPLLGLSVLVDPLVIHRTFSSM